ncbi:hypothetical protein [Salisediminibacterium selenitireducens]|uniref:Uncharacterized protein n=1 Tax=Bacillus selenitireducens (strain ATCC 700615 / DSM 15326 / MLS10) TaxID=439292 RepID=D6XX64_BACIE|nr:hypothetical protein [Salisediminibacterium selenitireducens]ADH97921.1 hypothetical protein Bsel_0381 [[Bacillus] selenitireducens MLS10]
MKKPVFLPIVAAVSTAAVLFGVGNATGIPYLTLEWGPGNLEITFIPIIAGVAAGFLTERLIMKWRKVTVPGNGV